MMVWTLPGCFDEWCHQRGINLDFMRPGKPTENADWFESIEDAKEKIDGWR